MYNHILISTDGSEVAQKGVDHGLSLAKSLGARATISGLSNLYCRFPRCCFSLVISSRDHP
jgi:nucleotide-binding universal stress UspA family protein